MSRTRYGKMRILLILREVESGATVGDVCRTHGISRSTFYRWRRAYGQSSDGRADGMDEIVEESVRLKRLLREAMSSLRAVRKATESEKRPRDPRRRATTPCKHRDTEDLP